MHSRAGFLVVGAATRLPRVTTSQSAAAEGLVSKAEANGEQAEASSDLALVLCFNTPDYVSDATLRPGTAVPASSASPERLFSSVGIVKSDLRGSLQGWTPP
jgi:hypothetical protein